MRSVRGLRVLVLGVGIVSAVVILDFALALRGRASAPGRSGMSVQLGSDTLAVYAGSAADRSPLEFDFDLLWRNQPGVEMTQAVAPAPFQGEAAWTARINADGFRGPERGKSIEDGYRVLCIGDSVTYGFNVDQDATYPAQLQSMLETRYPGRRFDVINAGVPGWSWVQSAAFLVRDGLALRPDVIVLGHGADHQMWPADVTDSERIWFLSDEFVRRSVAFQLAAHRSFVIRRITAWLGGSSADVWTSPGCRQQIEDGGACRRVSVPEIEATVKRAAEIARSAGVTLLLLNVDFLDTPASDAVRRAVERNAVGLVDYAQSFRSERLRWQISRARELGLAPPHVPLIRRPIGFPTVLEQEARMRFRVLKTAEGVELRLRGRGYPDTTFSVDQELYDDGTRGDETAGDGVFSAIVQTRPSVAAVGYRFFLDGVPEFRDLPGMRATNGDRVLQFNGDGDAAVESFGVRYRMTDELHPDPSGHASIAAGVLREIEATPSFRRFVALRSPMPGEPIR